MAMKSWQGSVNLDYGVQGNQTQIVSVYSKAPFKVQRPFYPAADSACHSVLVHTAGGMVGGDRLSIDLNLQPHSHALVTTSAAGKVYRSEAESCHQIITINLDASALCEWVPQESILFEGAKFHQTMRVNLAPTALWMGMEFFRFGRTARGERFRLGEWRSQSEVWQQGHPLWIDRSVLSGEMSQSPTTLGTTTVMGTLVVLGRDFEKAAIAQIRQDCIPELIPQGHIGISRLPQGVICRYLGSSTAEGRHYFLKIWENLRQIYAGRGICIPRVWQL